MPYLECRALILKGKPTRYGRGTSSICIGLYNMCNRLLTTPMQGYGSHPLSFCGWANNLIDPDCNESTCTRAHMCMHQNEVQMLLQSFWINEIVCPTIEAKGM